MKSADGHPHSGQTLSESTILVRTALLQPSQRGEHPPQATHPGPKSIAAEARPGDCGVLRDSIDPGPLHLHKNLSTLGATRFSVRPWLK